MAFVTDRPSSSLHLLPQLGLMTARLIRPFCLSMYQAISHACSSMKQHDYAHSCQRCLHYISRRLHESALRLLTAGFGGTFNGCLAGVAGWLRAAGAAGTLSPKADCSSGRDTLPRSLGRLPVCVLRLLSGRRAGDRLLQKIQQMQFISVSLTAYPCCPVIIALIPSAAGQISARDFSASVLK